MLRKLLLNKNKTEKAQNNLNILYSRYLQNLTGIVVGMI